MSPEEFVKTLLSANHDPAGDPVIDSLDVSIATDSPFNHKDAPVVLRLNLSLVIPLNAAVVAGLANELIQALEPREQA